MKKILAALGWLLSGLGAYWLFQSDVLVFKGLGCQGPHLILSSNLAQAFFTNHYADLAWCAAAFTIAGFLRERGYPSFYANVLTVLPFLSELAQACPYVPGTFDWLDLMTYAALFPMFHRKEFTHMRPLKQHLLGSAFVAVFIAALIGSGGPVYKYQTGVFRLPVQQDEVWTKPSLATILKTSKSRSIVLRVPAPGDKVTEEQTMRNNTLYSTIEKELSKAGFTVRDRQLFSKVIEQGNLDYTKIGFLTETDLILELVRYTKYYHGTTEYQDESGTLHKNPNLILFTTALIEFKLTAVKENDIAGTMVFHYNPCKDGCTRRFSPQLSKSADVPLIEEEVYKDFALRLVAQLNQYK